MRAAGIEPDTLTRMLPAALWLAYAVPAYVLWTLVFRVRFGFWPTKERFPPRDLYGWMDFGLAVVLIGYSVWIVLGPRPDPSRAISLPAGAAIWGAGVLLRSWAIIALGRNWRIGQDEHDERAEFVATGPYRLMHHPINAALIVVSIGQGLMTGLDVRAIVLLGYAVLYFLVQGRAEDRAWAKRKAHNTQHK